MKLYKAFKYALNMVLHSKIRSWLTILGIVIGVASVISIMSMGAGLQEDISDQLGAAGGDILTLSPGFSRATGFARMHGGGGGGGAAQASDEEIVLARTDVQALKGLSDVKLINTNIAGKADIYYFGKQGSVTVTGVDVLTWSQITIKKAAEGRFLGPSDINVVMIGGTLANEFFDKAIGINQMITIEDRAFRVVGILDDQSTTIIMPIQMAIQVLDDKKIGVYDTIEIKIKDEERLDLAIAAINAKLKVVRKVTEKDKDFTIRSSKEQAQRRAEMLGSMTAFLTAIAAVALLVGAVGIANTMFTSVLEKTKEIGIMKAVGARNKDILTIFLLNAVLIGLIGGLIGIFFGYILSGILPVLMGGGGGITGRLTSSTVITWDSVILALSISVIIGTISGAIPAYQASKLKPVDALRYD